MWRFFVQQAVSVIIGSEDKMNGLKVYEYLNWVFERIRNCDFNKMEDLVPWSEKIPEYVRIEGEKSDKLSVLESA